jgi:phage portal protein BeeE
MLLWGVTEIIKPELSSADLQFLENRKFSRAEICAAFGVPEEIITTTDHAKYDVVAGARLNFIEHRVIPLCARLEAEENATVIPALNSQLSTLNSPVVGWFDIDSLPTMQEARRSRLAAAKTGFDMGIPFNELNRVYDLGFKSLPWGNTGYLPSKLVKAGSLPSPPSSSSSS